MRNAGRHSVLGVLVSAVDYEAVVDAVAVAAHAGRSLTVSATAVHGVMTAASSSVHRHRLNSFDFIVPDGQPVRWALNLLHATRLRERVYGPTLMLRVCERAARDGLPIFLYGSTASTVRRLVDSLLERIPALVLAGARPSAFRQLSADEAAAITADIRASGARIVFVGLGCPRQEVWAYENAPALGMPVVAVGAAFDFHAGVLAQAPALLQRVGLEWLFRLTQEPRRLWRRYLTLNPAYMILLAAQRLGLRHFDSHGEQPGEAIRYG